MEIYFIGYGLSVVVATPVTYLWSWILHKYVQKLPRTCEDKEAKRILWIPLVLGIFERVIITTLAGWKITQSLRCL